MNTNKTISILNAVLIAAVVTMLPELVFAQDANLSNSVNSVQSGLKNMPQLIAGAFYIGGAALIGAGALKLKAHSENPTNAPIGHGLGRIVAGSALIAIPSFSSWLNNSLSIGTNSFTESSFGPLTAQ